MFRAQDGLSKTRLSEGPPGIARTFYTPASVGLETTSSPPALLERPAGHVVHLAMRSGSPRSGQTAVRDHCREVRRILAALHDPHQRDGAADLNQDGRRFDRPWGRPGRSGQSRDLRRVTFPQLFGQKLLAHRIAALAASGHICPGCFGAEQAVPALLGLR